MPYGPRGQGRGSYKHKARDMRQQRRLALDMDALQAAAASPYTFTFAATADNYTMLETDLGIRSTGVGVSGKTWTLHGAPIFPLLCINHPYPVTITLDPAGSVQIDGAATKNISTGNYRFYFDGTEWWSY